MGIKLRLVTFDKEKSRWNTEDGELHPGDCYYLKFSGTCKDCGCPWDNCDGRHFIVVLPNGAHWHAGFRASNCGRPDDKTHRCWVVLGELPNITIDKNGDTCPAGAGSILCGGWHGFIRNGELVEC